VGAGFGEEGEERKCGEVSGRLREVEKQEECGERQQRLRETE
jgi:hypothetical protein